jgi:hypothetical protein
LQSGSPHEYDQESDHIPEDIFSMRLKKLGITALVAFTIASVVALGIRTAYVARYPAPPPGEQLPDAVVVFCFHGHQRCPTDKDLEEYTHEVLKQSFATPLRKGKIVWRVLNYETPENAHFRKDYQVTRSTIVLADARADRPGVAKNLQPKVDKLIKDKEDFQTYLREEIENFLK